MDKTRKQRITGAFLKEKTPSVKNLLIKKEYELEQIFNTAANAMWVVDTDFNVIRINETFKQLNVLSDTHIKNKKCYELFKSSLCNTEECPLRKILQGEESVERELEKSKNDGTVAIFLVKAVPFRKSDGSLVGIVEDLQDVTRLKLAEERARKLSQRLINAIEEERARISRELHNELGQILTSIKMDASWLRNHIFKDKVENKTSIKKVLKGMCDSIDRLIDEVREVSFELRPSILDDMGLEAAVLWLAEEMKGRSDIECNALFDLKRKRFPKHLETSLFRIIQESMTNVARHANASRILIEAIETDDMLKLQIIDDGIGIDNKKIIDPQSVGIAGMFEHAKTLCGNLKITGESGKGTRVVLEIPLLDEQKQKDEL